MTTRHSTDQGMFYGYFAAVAVLAVCSAGCQFNAEGKDNSPPDLCQLDLDPSAIIIDDAPDSPFVEDDGHFPDEAFIVRWNVCYHADLKDWGEDTGEYVSQVEFLQDGELVWIDDMVSDPLSKHSCRYDEIPVPDGLPAGQYKVRLTLDPDGVVPECESTIIKANNVLSNGLEVMYHPIDDFTEPPSDDSEPVDKFENPTPKPGNDQLDPQTNDDPSDDGKPSNDPNARDPNDDDPDPDDSKPIDPKPPAPGKFNFATAAGNN